MSFWGLPGGRRAFSPRGAAGGGAGSGGEHNGGERGRERAAGGAAGRGSRARRVARQAARRARGRAPAGGTAGNPVGAGESPGGRRGRQPGGRGGEPRRAARQAARRSLWADAAALHGKARPPAQARAWSGRGALFGRTLPPSMGKPGHPRRRAHGPAGAPAPPRHPPPLWAKNGVCRIMQFFARHVHRRGRVMHSGNRPKSKGLWITWWTMWINPPPGCGKSRCIPVPRVCISPPPLPFFPERKAAKRESRERS